MSFQLPKELRKRIDARRNQEERDYFFKVPYRLFSLIQKLNGAFPLYLYMADNITRGKGNHQWWNENVLPYYKIGHLLPFAKHQSFIADDLKINQSSISRQLKLLEEMEIIFQIDRVKFKPNRYMNIYSLGEWYILKGNRKELYYFHDIGI